MLFLQNRIHIGGLMGFRSAPVWLIGVLGAVVLASGAQETPPAKPAPASKKFVLEEQRIEGKIRRPQLVLIKADQRPSFEPMSMQSFGKNFNVAESVDQNVLESSPYRGAFQFENRGIADLAP